jgi:diguanylate cyclase (GGDEF)-like protein/PAS domain S-box-containing protein
VVSGVVITLTDINETKLLQQNKMELESDLKLALKTGLIGVWHSNLKTKDFSFDETLMTILGLKNHSSITKFKQFINLIHPNDKKLLEEAFATAVSKNESLEQSFRIYRPDGSIRHLSCSANVHNGLSASTNHLTGICWDMTERYWLEERIIDAEHLNIGLDSITDGWWDWDLVTDKAYLSPLLKKTIGYRDAELPNQRAVYEQLIVQRDRIDARKLLETYIASNNTQPVIKEIRMKHKTGHVIWILSRIKGIANKEGKLIRIISTITDISALKEKERALKKLAYHDPLTLVSNKPVYFEAVFRAIARAKRNHSLFAVMFVDVDDFKGVNDQWGHSVGDGLLCEVTNRLTNLSRSIDLLARIGGDEFAILLEEVSTIDEVRTIAARYIAGFSEPMILNDTSLVVTISIGVALFPVHGKTVSEVLSHADKNMYRAKKAGKNQFVLCD